MTHTKLYFKMLHDDPSQQVLWNQERPIAYLDRADAGVAEFVELENLIQAAPKMLEALWAFADHTPEMWGDEVQDGWLTLRVSADTIHKMDEAIQKAKA